MQVTLASQDGFLLATATGQASGKEVLRVFMNVIDRAMERGFKQIKDRRSATRKETGYCSCRWPSGDGFFRVRRKSSEAAAPIHST